MFPALTILLSTCCVALVCVRIATELAVKQTSPDSYRDVNHDLLFHVLRLTSHHLFTHLPIAVGIPLTTHL
jgi:hypothetical protein